MDKKNETPCNLCGTHKKTHQAYGYTQICSSCRSLVSGIKNHPEIIKKVWPEFHTEAILPSPKNKAPSDIGELPDVLDGKRYQTIDRERNKWYLSISEVEGQPVEVFASTAFDRDHELQSRISNLTTITRLISLNLRHIFIGEHLDLKKILKQLKRSSRQRNDLPDMLYKVLARYEETKS